MLKCCLCSSPVPEDRQKRKGYAAVTCGDTCYQQFRKQKKSARRTYRVEGDERALLLRLRRVKFTLADFDVFALWWRGWRDIMEAEKEVLTEAADTARHDLNAGV